MVVYLQCRWLRQWWDVLSKKAPAFGAQSICNNPIPGWQSRIGMHWIFNERSDAVCTTVFGIYIFCKDFRPNTNENIITRLACGCDLHVFAPTFIGILDESIPSARIFRIQISNPSKSWITFLFRFTSKMTNRTAYSVLVRIWGDVLSIYQTANNYVITQGATKNTMKLRLLQQHDVQGHQSKTQKNTWIPNKQRTTIRQSSTVITKG